MKQNIYDNEVFFESFRELREREDCYNELLEQPAMQKLLPDLNGKSVLDLGCGFGINCREFANSGAEAVYGADISEKMIDFAIKNNSMPNITYYNIPAEDVSQFDRKFDLVYSSLCFHYVKDFQSLISDIYTLLYDGGTLLFSQEHPIVTASAGIANHYIDDENGNKVFCLCDYQDEESPRIENWFVDGVMKYHRTVSTVINAILDSGFVIERLVEPVPDANALAKRPGLAKEFIKPTFLIIKAVKK